MKLLVYSDLHLDHQPFSPILPDGRRVDEDADMVILAGDIDEGTRGMRWARETFPDKGVLYVAGNHEFYEHHWTRHLDDLRDAANKYEIDFLEVDGIDIGGIRFLGCTLWTSFELYGNKEVAMRRAKATMTDYVSIRVSRTPELHWLRGKYLIPELTAMRHQGSVEWLEGKLKHGDPSKTVVITHHAPHPISIPERFKGHEVSPAYASDLTRLLGRAKLWVHGHVHSPWDYEINGTRVISNPRGYTQKNGGWENHLFNPVGIWEV